MNLDITSDRQLAQRLTIGYTAGLFLIALLSISVHFLLDSVIAQQRDFGTVVNIAGRQRMLSQRIALLAQDATGAEDEDQALLESAINLMERSQNAIVRGGDLKIRHQLSDLAHAYYFTGPDALDPQVRLYLAGARAFLKTAPDSTERAAARRALQDKARSGLLPALDGAVTIFEQEANARVDGLRRAQMTVLLILLCAVALEALFIFRPMVRLVSRYTRNLYEMATLDGLTGLSNRRHFMENADRLFRISKRSDVALAAMILDLDHFKQINDVHGHQAGDDVLKFFSAQIRGVLRSSDLCGRTGGEEFAILVPGVTQEMAKEIAERIRVATATVREDGLPEVTVSIGIAMLGDRDKALDDLLGRADTALYRAKGEGRNRIAL
jgi:diguanylate cyclase (GGDEF)-like protein